MSATKREEVSSHLRYIRLELREMHQMLIKEDLLPDLNEAKEVLAQLCKYFFCFIKIWQQIFFDKHLMHFSKL